MTASTINQMHAVDSGSIRPVRIPDNLNPRALVSILGQMGLMIPTKLSAAAAGDQPLRASGHRFAIKEIDNALAGQDLSISDRIRIKRAMEANGILGG